MKSIIAAVAAFALLSGPLLASHEKHDQKQKSLPQGLQMKLDRGGSLPPGWERKLRPGTVLEEPLYQHSEIVIPVDTRGLLTVRIEGKLIRLVEATREIIDIVEILNR